MKDEDRIPQPTFKEEWLPVVGWYAVFAFFCVAVAFAGDW